MTGQPSRAGTRSRVRFTKGQTCPVCGGSESGPRGQGQRCHGYIEGDWIHCSREEHAGNTRPDRSGTTWSHKAEGPCPCGRQHAPAPGPPSRSARRPIDRVYKYRDPAGHVVYETVRFNNPKDFRQRRPVEHGRYMWNLSGVHVVLYNLPALCVADPAATVWIVEGEKDADRLGSLGLLATTSPMGAGKWHLVDSSPLHGRPCVIIADNDDTGRKHVQQAAADLYGKAASVKTLELPGLPERGDVSDWLDQGGTVEQLVALAAAAPAWLPDATHGPVPSSNGNGKHAPSSETSDDEDFADPIGTVDPVAFHGVLGEIVNKLLPATEANGLFILAHLLAMCGAAMGRSPCFGRGLDLHMNPQFALIGPTARGRKRTAGVIAERAFRVADPEFADKNIFDGLASGRGLMEHLRDPSTRLGEKGKEVHDKGVEDKRRLFIEEELASVLKHGGRDAETLLPLVRQFADAKHKIHMATKVPITVTDAHLCIVGHGTPAETRSLLMDRDVSGGTWNRFVWLWGVRHQSLPGGADVDGVINDFLQYELGRLREALLRAKATTTVVFAPKIGKRWETVYRKLEADTPSGPIADHYSRAPSNVLRLACIYSLLDFKHEIADIHLDAALAIWSHSDRTLKYMFAADVNQDAEKVKIALRAAPEGLTKMQISQGVFGGRMPLGVNDVLRDLLAERTILAKKVQPERGRPATLFLWNDWR